MNRKTLSGLVAACLAGSWVYAAGAGTSGGVVLNIPVGARAVAMGEAYTAQADDVSSLYWNPAGLALLNQSQASFMYNQWLEGLSYSNLGIATPLENGGIGASLSYLSYGDIKGYSESDVATGNVDAYNAVATVGGAFYGEIFSAGVNLKGVQGVLADEKATGFAADFGVNAVYPEEVMTGTLRAAVTLRNVGTGLKYLNEKDPFPTQLRAGLAAVQMLNRKLNISMDYGKTRDNKGAIYGGGEFWFAKFLALRAGYAGTSDESAGLRAGLGLRIKDLSFDYAYSPFGDLGMAHRYELTYRFGAVKPLLTPEERKLMRRGKQAMRDERYGEAVMIFSSLVDMEPRYKPFKKLVKQAMAQNERQERFANNPNNYKIPAKMVTLKDSNPDEQAELEQLLNLNNEEQARNLQPSKEKSR